MATPAPHSEVSLQGERVLHVPRLRTGNVRRTRMIAWWMVGLWICFFSWSVHRLYQESARAKTLFDLFAAKDEHFWALRAKEKSSGDAALIRTSLTDVSEQAVLSIDGIIRIKDLAGEVRRLHLTGEVHFGRFFEVSNFGFYLTDNAAVHWWLLCGEMSPEKIVAIHAMPNTSAVYTGQRPHPILLGGRDKNRYAFTFPSPDPNWLRTIAIAPGTDLMPRLGMRVQQILPAEFLVAEKEFTEEKDTDAVHLPQSWLEQLFEESRS